MPMDSSISTAEPVDERRWSTRRARMRSATATRPRPRRRGLRRSRRTRRRPAGRRRSSGRTALRAAARRSGRAASSPTWWPRVSLTRLKSSRSISIRRERRAARARASPTPGRARSRRRRAVRQSGQGVVRRPRARAPATIWRRVVEQQQRDQEQREQHPVVRCADHDDERGDARAPPKVIVRVVRGSPRSTVSTNGAVDEPARRPPARG